MTNKSSTHIHAQYPQLSYKKLAIEYNKWADKIQEKTEIRNAFYEYFEKYGNFRFLQVSGIEYTNPLHILSFNELNNEYSKINKYTNTQRPNIGNFIGAFHSYKQFIEDCLQGNHVIVPDSVPDIIPEQSSSQNNLRYDIDKKEYIQPVQKNIQQQDSGSTSKPQQQRPKWNIHEAAILLDSYLQVSAKTIEEKDAVAEVSKKLRQMARNSNQAIDETYRNINGIQLQMSSMDSAYKGKNTGIHTSKLFNDIVNIYRTSPDEYNSILTEAINKCADSIIKEKNIDTEAEITYVNDNNSIAHFDHYLYKKNKPDTFTINNTENNYIPNSSVPYDNTISLKDRLISLFEYISKLEQINNNVVINYNNYEYTCFFDDIPDNQDYVKLNYGFDENDSDQPLLEIKKAKENQCPSPDSSFKHWLEDGWNNYKNSANIKQQLNNESFESSQKRVNDYKAWLAKRTQWTEEEQQKACIRSIFDHLFKFHQILKDQSESYELIAADGFYRDKTNNAIDHPIITKKVNIEFDVIDNIIRIKDSDNNTQLYKSLFEIAEAYNISALNRFETTVNDSEIHPLGGSTVSDLLKGFIHSLSSKGEFFEEKEEIQNIQKDTNIYIYRNPCLIFRQKINKNLLDDVIAIIKDTDEEDLPAPLTTVLAPKKNPSKEPDTTPESREEKLAAAGGESIDVYLTKPANREQLEIAHKIERYNIVEVQGPPGTGKTYTIANLLGHFLSQGKNVLVTSYTSKALKVLKEKIEPELRTLCVSVLDDNSKDLEESIKGINNIRSSDSIEELDKKINNITTTRNTIISDLAQIRKKMFAVLHQECSTMVINGEGISPADAAKFIKQTEHLNYIPGEIIEVPFPLTEDEITALYKSNISITVDDEKEIDSTLPNPEHLILPAYFEDTIQKIQHLNYEAERSGIIDELQFSFSGNRQITCTQKLGNKNISLTFCCPSKDKIAETEKYIKNFIADEKWMIGPITDGKKGEVYANRWLSLKSTVEETKKQHEIYIKLSTGKGHITCPKDNTNLLPIYKKIAAQIGSVKFKLIIRNFDKTVKEALKCVTIDGSTPTTKEDCEIIISYLETLNLRHKCANIWNQCFNGTDIPEFDKLSHGNGAENEDMAYQYMKQIPVLLKWYNDGLPELQEKIHAIGLDFDNLISKSINESDKEYIERLVHFIINVLPKICAYCQTINSIIECENIIAETKEILAKNTESTYCISIIDSINNKDCKKYHEQYNSLANTYKKAQSLRERRSSLNKLRQAAPQWAEAIENRDGIHGSKDVPEDYLKAWNRKLYEQRVTELLKISYPELNNESKRLGEKYRQKTKEYVMYSSYKKLKQKLDANDKLSSNLVQWLQFQNKIGRGTGKNAKQLKLDAKRCMTNCQDAVPVWIMPLSRAAEMLNPAKNRFDIIIIDEASQANLAALGVLYMADKLIVVGDDKQVSPMAIGTKDDDVAKLQNTYIAGKIDNYKLFDGRYSIYDLAATCGTPLMLKEHFRCYPEIISFSNFHCYNGKIIPLRTDSDSLLKPAVINYRVENGQREGKKKINKAEALAIAALMKACSEQPEYSGKTFGAITLLGGANDQSAMIQYYVNKLFTPAEINNRHIRCGISPDFQGDERDIIFLSTVDSNEGEGPIRKLSEGTYSSTLKRYNVAASRGRDQLWIVNSLDAANDLKLDDMRKLLIEFAINPEEYSHQMKKIEAESESPFEEAVAKALVGRGYNIIQQRKVGAYRIDISVTNGKKEIAVECDGDRYHSGEQKISEDMNRQAILERVGWKFIRIRGSEYYYNQEETINRVDEELKQYGILPCLQVLNKENENRETDLLRLIKTRAAKIIEECKENNEEFEEKAIPHKKCRQRGYKKTTDIPIKEPTLFGDFEKEHPKNKFSWER